MKIDYEKLTEITVRTQEELDLIPANFAGQIYIEGGTIWAPIRIKRAYNNSVVLRENSRAELWENSSAVLWGNSSAVLRGNSRAALWGNSRAELLENSSAVLRGNSRAVLRENSRAELRENSSAELRENSSAELWENSYAELRENSRAELRENSSAVLRENSSAVLRGNSRAVLWGNSRAELWGNSRAELRENSRAELRENSSAVLLENSSAVLWGNSSAVLRGNSRAVLWGNSRADASGNSQVVDMLQGAKIKVSGNARIVYMPKNIFEFMDFYGIKHTKTTAIFYKAVHKDANNEGKYYSDYNPQFVYEVGKIYEEVCDKDTAELCGSGLHIAHLSWALGYGNVWSDVAILEVKTRISDIVCPKNSDGKVRTAKLEVIREVPLEECGVYGEMIKRRLNKQ